MKKLIRLTESDLHNIIKNSVRSILKESMEVWKKNNDVLYTNAVNKLSEYVLSMYDPEDLIGDPENIEEEVEESWQNVLDEKLVDAIYDKIDVANVTDKNMYGGGGYEILRNLAADVRDNVLNILQNGNNN